MSNLGDASAIEQIQWPDLAEPYASALRAAVRDVLDHYDPIGLIAAGSILRGEGGPTSDIDLYVVHPAHFRQRLQRIYGGVPFEIFVNPSERVREYFVEEHATRPITAHMFATGTVLLDRDPIIQQLRLEATTWLSTPPNPSADALRWRSYLIVDMLDNVRDVIQIDSAMARILLYRVVDQLVEMRFLAANRHFPRTKRMLSALRELDGELADDLEQFFATSSVAEQFELVAGMSSRIAHAEGFFVWDSPVEIVKLEGGA